MILLQMHVNGDSTYQQKSQSIVIVYIINQQNQKQ